MKHLLNTLYVTTPESYLHRDGETIKVEVEGQIRLQIPLHNLESIVCFGHSTVTAPLLELCAKKQVSLAFLSMTGRFMARMQGPVSGNVLLRREQYRRAENLEKSLTIARSIVAAKIANSRGVVLRIMRDRSENSATQALRQTTERLARILKDVIQAGDLDGLRGHEGDAAKTYFNVFDHFILQDKEQFYFRERNRRPPLDNVNALLSFLYTLLTHDTASALEGVGLDPAVGYLHRDRPGRPGLALDLIEELRACLADRLALSLINRQQVKASGFKKQETGAVLMDDDTRKTVLVAYQKRKQETIYHPFLGEKISVGLLPHIQSLLLARHLRGDLDAYPPYFWK